MITYRMLNFLLVLWVYLVNALPASETEVDMYVEAVHIRRARYSIILVRK